MMLALLQKYTTSTFIYYKGNKTEKHVGWGGWGEGEKNKRKREREKEEKNTFVSCILAITYGEMLYKY